MPYGLEPSITKEELLEAIRSKGRYDSLSDLTIDLVIKKLGSDRLTIEAINLYHSIDLDRRKPLLELINEGYLRVEPDRSLVYRNHNEKQSPAAVKKQIKIVKDIWETL